MSQIYVLFEHAAGFAVFRTTEFEEVAIFLPQVQKSILDISKFRSVVYLITFQPFKNQKDAFENMKSIVAGELTSDLQLFLENNIPRTKKSKQTVILGVQDPDLASVISDRLNIKCISSAIVKEICRGIRFHFPKFVKGYKDANCINSAELALAHCYSRKKVNFDAARLDTMITQSLNLIDELEKDIRKFTARVRHWYSYHFPELAVIVKDDFELYVKCINVIGDRKSMPEDTVDKLHVFIKDQALVDDILFAASNSMGMDISSTDLENIQMFCQRILSLIYQQQSSIDYLKAKMLAAAPNISKVVGEMLGSRLISRAGGLAKLAKLPASAVQVLGAGKGCFRSLNKKERPTWGLLAESSSLLNASSKKRKKVLRMLAHKCILASRIDCFSKNLNNTFGSSILQEVENFVSSFKDDKNKENITSDMKDAIENIRKCENDVETYKQVENEDISHFNKDKNLVDSVENEAMIDLDQSVKAENKNSDTSSSDTDTSEEENSETESSSEKSFKTEVKISKKRKLKNDSPKAEISESESFSEESFKSEVNLLKKQKSEDDESPVLSVNEEVFESSVKKESIKLKKKKRHKKQKI